MILKRFIKIKDKPVCPSDVKGRIELGAPTTIIKSSYRTLVLSTYSKGLDRRFYKVLGKPRLPGFLLRT